MLLTWFSRRILENEGDENILIVILILLASPVLIVDFMTFLSQLFVPSTMPLSPPLYPLNTYVVSIQITVQSSLSQG